MSDDTNKAFDPTESVRTLSSAPFKESYMTLREHQDTDRHYIGDALPVPSLSQMKGTGASSSAGEMPFPARVDHVHDLHMVWGFFSSTWMTMPPGLTYVNNLTHTGWGRNMLATSQVLAFPWPGVYSLKMSWVCSRNAGGNFTAEMNMGTTLYNGTSNKILSRFSMYDIPATFYFVSEEIYVSGSAPSITDNIQFFIEHNDGSNWSVAMQHLLVVRLCGVNSN